MIEIIYQSIPLRLQHFSCDRSIASEREACSTTITKFCSAAESKASAVLVSQSPREPTVSPRHLNSGGRKWASHAHFPVLGLLSGRLSQGVFVFYSLHLAYLVRLARAIAQIYFCFNALMCAPVVHRILLHGKCATHLAVFSEMPQNLSSVVSQVEAFEVFTQIDTNPQKVLNVSSW